MKIQRALIVACCTVVFAICTVAQDQPPAPAGNTGNNPPTAQDSSATTQTATAASTPDPLAVHLIGSAFSVDTSVWRFGPFYLNSVSVGEGYYLGTTDGR